MSARWYKRCGADFIHGTMMLTLEEKGAYSLCLDLIYDRGGPIPDDARWMSGVCGVSLRKWNAIRDRLISLGKITAEDGHISNSRAAFELVSHELQARKFAESGAKGGRKRAENAAQANENSDLGQATLKHIRVDKSREEDTNKLVSIAKPHKPRGTRLSDDFSAPTEWLDWASVKMGWARKDAVDEAEVFARYWQAKPGRDAVKLDWFKTWQNWVGNSHRRSSPNGRDPYPPGHSGVPL